MINPRSEPTYSGKVTGHESVNQPLESLALRLSRPVRQYDGNLCIMYQPP